MIMKNNNNSSNKFYSWLLFLIVLLALRARYGKSVLPQISRQYPADIIAGKRWSVKDRVLGKDREHEALIRLKRLLQQAEFAVPVIYIEFASTNDNLLYLAEVATASGNVVIILSDTFQTIWTDLSNPTSRVFYFPIYNIPDSFLNSKFQQMFIKYYRHLPKSLDRPEYEKMCIRRWFVLHSFTNFLNIAKFFYGDGDTMVFYSMTKSFQVRNNCSAVLVTHNDQSINRYFGHTNGHSSLWTMEALDEFCWFIAHLYSEHINLLQNSHERVSDMELAWLWTVAKMSSNAGGIDGFHWKSKQEPSFPIYQHKNRIFVMKFTTTLKDLQNSTIIRKMNDYINSKAVNVSLTKNSEICNGLDVYESSVFDHGAPFLYYNFTFGIDALYEYYVSTQENHQTKNLSVISKVNNSSTPLANQFKFDLLMLPYMIGSLHPIGGRPERISEIQPKPNLDRFQKLYFLTIHYTGNKKSLIKFDACRRLVLMEYSSSFIEFNGSFIIQDPFIRDTCHQINQYKFSKSPLRFPAPFNHEIDINKKAVIL